MYVMDRSIAVNHESHNLAADTAWKPEYYDPMRKKIGEMRY